MTESTGNYIYRAVNIINSNGNAKLATESVYNCQATNELGPGEIASTEVKVHQLPFIEHKLKALKARIRYFLNGKVNVVIHSKTT